MNDTSESSLGAFFRVFWRGGGCADFDPEEGRRIMRIHAEHLQGGSEHTTGASHATNADGEEVQFHASEVIRVHYVTPESRRAQQERCAALMAEQDEFRDRPTWDRH